MMLISNFVLYIYELASISGNGQFKGFFFDSSLRYHLFYFKFNSRQISHLRLKKLKFKDKNFTFKGEKVPI